MATMWAAVDGSSQREVSLGVARTSRGREGGVMPTKVTLPPEEVAAMDAHLAPLCGGTERPEAPEVFTHPG